MSNQIASKSSAKVPAVANNENNPNYANLKKMKTLPLTDKLTIDNIKCFNENCSSVVLILSSSVVVRCSECKSYLCLKCRNIHGETPCNVLSSSESSDDEVRPNIQQVVAEVHEEPKNISKKRLFSFDEPYEADNEGSDLLVPIEESESQTDTQSQTLEPLEEPESPVIAKPMSVASKTAEPVSSKAL